MKTMLIMTSSMVCGGVEKSLLSLMSICDDFDIDLLITHNRGSLLSHLPKHCQVRGVPWTAEHEYEWNNGKRKYLRALLISFRWIRALRLIFLHQFYLKWFVPVGRRRACRFMQMVDTKAASEGGQYDVAIAYGDMPEILMYVLKNISAKRKIACIHNDHPLFVFDRLAFGPEYKAYDLVSACSGELSEKITGLLAPYGVEVVYLPYILDQETYLKLASEPCPLDQNNGFLNIVSVGRVCEQKGFDIAIKVCANLIKEGVNVHWHIVGDGDEMESHKKIVAQYGLESYFHFVGMQLNPYPYIYHCDIYVQPSRYEGYCLTLAEARLLERPIVTTNFIGAREQIVDGVTGLIAECNATALTDAVRRLAGDAQSRQEFTENLRRQNHADNARAKLRELLFS